MWVIAVIALGVIILLTIIIANNAKVNHKDGDYGDGGGKQVGGDGDISFFAPANDRAGVYGEKLVNYHIRPLLKEDEYLLVNLLLPLRNGYKTEIDAVIVSRKGIFCIETKNWVGCIRGNDNDEYWYQEYDDPSMADKRHKNPVKQNEGHAAIVKRILGYKYIINNVVIFLSLEYGGGINSDYAYSLDDFVKHYRTLKDEVLSETKINSIYHQLVKYVATKEELAKHREETRRRFN